MDGRGGNQVANRSVREAVVRDWNAIAATVGVETIPPVAKSNFREAFHTRFREVPPATPRMQC